MRTATPPLANVSELEYRRTTTNQSRLVCRECGRDYPTLFVLADGQPRCWGCCDPKNRKGN